MTFNIIWQKLIIEARALTTDYVIIQKTMSPRKSEEDVMIKFFKSQEGQKQSFSDIPQNWWS